MRRALDVAVVATIPDGNESLGLAYLPAALREAHVATQRVENELRFEGGWSTQSVQYTSPYVDGTDQINELAAATTPAILAQAAAQAAPSAVMPLRWKPFGFTSGQHRRCETSLVPNVVGQKNKK